MEQNKASAKINIVGAGLSGLSAAITLAEMGIACNLISSMPSERAQSVLAEGGINAALDTMGENDTTDDHFADTLTGGVYLESESAVRNLTENAPAVVQRLVKLGVPFNSAGGNLILRNFGGQKKKRTAYAKSSTGKMIMTALIDEVRKYEASGLVTRWPHHELTDICTAANTSDCRLQKSPRDPETGSSRSRRTGRSGKYLKHITVRDSFSGEFISFSGSTILCTGGLNGIFEGLTTGTTQNTGNAAALAFDAGIYFANLEFIQYHPTTAAISNKLMLISEAARGEGGRLWILKDGKPWYFMEEKYPELGNLMPRDVVSREMVFAKETEGASGDVFLDMTELPDGVWDNRLSDLRAEIISYLMIDPAVEPVRVTPGIHFFMGGIRVDDSHRTNSAGLYAAGEAACKYHGANRLGGNSMLGAIYGGRVAALTAAEEITGSCLNPETEEIKDCHGAHAGISDGQNALTDDTAAPAGDHNVLNPGAEKLPGDMDMDASPSAKAELREILSGCLGIVRKPDEMSAAEKKLEEITEGLDKNSIDRKRAVLGLAMLRSALARKESRGSHYRIDHPETSDEYKKLTMAAYDRSTDTINIRFAAAGESEIDEMPEAVGKSAISDISKGGGDEI